MQLERQSQSVRGLDSRPGCIQFLSSPHFFLKGQTLSVFSFVSQAVSVTTTQLCHCSRKQL